MPGAGRHARPNMPQSRRAPEQAERLREVVHMRCLRMTEAEIAAELGTSQPRVSQLYAVALREIPARDVDLGRLGLRNRPDVHGGIG